MMISGENHAANQIFSPLALKIKPGEFFKDSRLTLISAIAQNPFLTKRRSRKTYLVPHFLRYLSKTFRIPQKYYFYLNYARIFGKKSSGAEPRPFFACNTCCLRKKCVARRLKLFSKNPSITKVEIIFVRYYESFKQKY